VNNGFGACTKQKNWICDQFSEMGNCFECSKPFKSFGAGCRFVGKTDCLRFGEAGDCELCPPGKIPIVPAPKLQSTHDFDFEQNFCEPAQNAVDFCVYYSKDGKCLYCKKGYYESEGNCLKQIKNCLLSAFNICTSCKSGFKLLTPIENGKILSDGLSTVLKYDTTLELSATCGSENLIVTEMMRAAPEINYSVADQSSLDASCQKYAADGVACEVCSPNYFMSTSQQCIQPATVIADCKVYQSAFACATCHDGYHPSLNGDSCLVNPKHIENCVGYSDLYACVRCAAGYYVDSKNSCSAGDQIRSCTFWATKNICLFCL